jgi:hypothetical protein
MQEQIWRWFIVQQLNPNLIHVVPNCLHFLTVDLLQYICQRFLEVRKSKHPSLVLEYLHDLMIL